MLLIKMQRFELTVIRRTRFSFGILLIALSVTFLLSFIRELPIQKTMISIVLFGVLIVVLYFAIFRKIILSYSDDKISVVKMKRFMADNMEIESIDMNEIKALVVDEGKYLKKIITVDKIVEIDNVGSIENEFRQFIEKLSRIVEKNNGRVIDSKEYREIKGYDDFSFHLIIIFIAFSLCMIPRVWSLFEYYSLLFLFLPFCASLFHITQRIRKKRMNNG
jgi:hypothetical protein